MFSTTDLRILGKILLVGEINPQDSQHFNDFTKHMKFLEKAGFVQKYYVYGKEYWKLSYYGVILAGLLTYHISDEYRKKIPFEKLIMW